MTCQWCIHHRRKGISVCTRPGGDGNIMPAKEHGGDCEWFEPRRICTTCEHRCAPDRKETRWADSAFCRHWKLRKLSKWGGSRRHTRQSSSSDSPDSSTTQEKGAETCES